MADTIQILVEDSKDTVNVSVVEECEGVNINVAEFLTVRDSAISWEQLALNIKYDLDATLTIASGDVYTGVMDGNTYYRFISTALTGVYPTTDAFYTGFDGTNFTNLIAIRG